MGNNIGNHECGYLEPNYHVKVSLTIARSMGAWPPVSQPRRFFYFIYSFLTFTFIIGIVLAIQIINIFVVWGDMNRVIASVFPLLTHVVHMFKIIVMMRNQTLIQNLLNTLTTSLSSPDNKKYQEIFSDYAWRGLFHYICYQSSGSATVLAWSISPIIRVIIGTARQLPLVDAWYPYDTDKSPMFEITCAFEALSVNLASVYNISIDTFIMGLLNVVCCQLEIIKQNLKNFDLNSETNQIQEIQIYGELMKKKFNKCIQHTNTIMECVMELQTIFGWIILCQLSVNCFTICFTAFHITAMTSYVPSELFGMLMYLCCMIYQIFIYCYHGNELALQSQSISMAVFASNWWIFNKSFKQSFMILIERTHKPITFTAGVFVKLSLNTFVGILRASYSFFALLQSRATKKNL